VAPVRNVRETFFDTPVDDPYRYFEERKAPEVAAWMKAHSEHAHATLRRIGGRAALRRKLEEIDASASARVAGGAALRRGPVSSTSAAPRPRTSSRCACARA
jgi:prolyl oligopeptidase